MPSLRRGHARPFVALLAGILSAALGIAHGVPGAGTLAAQPAVAAARDGQSNVMAPQTDRARGAARAMLVARPYATVPLDLPLAAPLPALPPDGARLAVFNPTLSWSLPAGAAQYHLQVAPSSGDGPGLDLIRPAAGWYTLPRSPAWYGLLPDMTYTWRVRAAASINAIDAGDPSWGPWVPALRFHTPSASSATISLDSPTGGTQTAGLTPLLQWRDTNPDVWYYELQVSRDATFTTDPARATAAVCWELLHGGVTNPPRSYTVPASFPLEPGRTYYWRVRPRIQGDGQPVSWQAAATFRTPAPAPSPAPGSDLQILEQQALDRINDVRGQHGLAALRPAPELTAAGRRHSADMAGHTFMSHTGSDGSSFSQRISDAGYAWRLAGEIVAYGYPDAPAVVAAWMNSPGHRAIILTPDYREFGAGVARSAAGLLYWTVDFGMRAP